MSKEFNEIINRLHDKFGVNIDDIDESLSDNENIKNTLNGLPIIEQFVVGDNEYDAVYIPDQGLLIPVYNGGYSYSYLKISNDLIVKIINNLFHIKGEINHE